MENTEYAVNSTDRAEFESYVWDRLGYLQPLDKLTLLFIARQESMSANFETLKSNLGCTSGALRRRLATLEGLGYVHRVWNPGDAILRGSPELRAVLGGRYAF